MQCALLSGHGLAGGLGRGMWGLYLGRGCNLRGRSSREHLKVYPRVYDEQIRF